MEQTRRQVTAAAEAARQRLNSPELREKMNSLHQQMRNMVRLD
jgi:hypothetical protein